MAKGSLFNTIQLVKPRKNKFDLSHDVKLSCKMGQLVPICAMECVPGDYWNLGCDAMVRLAPLVSPMMHRCDVSMHYFFVPNRILWKNWEKFISMRGEGVPAFPTIIVQASNYTKLHDYMGIPIPIDTKQEQISAMPFAAYQMIFQEYYRDENLVPDVDFALVDGDNTANTGLSAMRLRAWEHDYFTSAIPWPQIGDAVSLPLSGDAPITGMGKLDQTWTATPTQFYESDGTRPTYAAFKQITDPNGNYFAAEESLTDAGYPGIFASLSSVDAVTINDLRQAFQLQALKERDARGGTRYTEIIRSHFNVISPDARLQRPEFLGGSSSPVQIMDIPQTGGTGDGADTPQGNLSGFGKVVSKSGFTKSFVEHGYILGLVSIRADITYQQGIDRMWSRSTKYDFYWPALAHLGEQAIPNKEIYAKGVTATDDVVFGYQERYAEYRYKRSLITGELRSTFAQSLDVWHLSQEFTDYPVLDNAFIVENPPVDRVIAVTSPVAPQFIFDSFIENRTVRPMPVYSVPFSLDRF